MTILYTEPVGQVRLLISDVDETNLTLSDEQILGYLSINTGDLRRAAADALDAIADSEILVSKVIKTQDLSTDGAKTADALRAHADRLRVLSDNDAFSFDIIDFRPYPYYPERVDGM